MNGRTKPPHAASTCASAPWSCASSQIAGIGSTYAQRLHEGGIETVADLAASDPETVAEAADVGVSRAEDWIEQARTL